MAEDNDQAGADSTQPEFDLLRVYLKDASFETPNSPAIFTEEWTPDIDLQLSSNVNSMEENLFEVVVTVTVTAKLGEKTGFLAEVHQAGLFALKGFDQPQLGSMLGGHCPNVLYPYAREAISNLVTKGGFPPVLLAPINFNALYAKRMADAANAGKAPEQA